MSDECKKAFEEWWSENSPIEKAFGAMKEGCWSAWQAAWNLRTQPQAQVNDVIRKDFLDDFGYDGYDEEDVKELKKYASELEKEILQSKGRQND